MTKEIGGTRHTFRLTSRAMMAAESTFKRGIVAIVSELEDDFRASTITCLIAVSGADGAGISIEQAQEVADELGLQGAGELLAEVVEAAFPDAKAEGEDAPGNATGAAPA